MDEYRCLTGYEHVCLGNLESPQVRFSVWVVHEVIPRGFSYSNLAFNPAQFLQTSLTHLFDRSLTLDYTVPFSLDQATHCTGITASVFPTRRMDSAASINISSSSITKMLLKTFHALLLLLLNHLCQQRKTTRVIDECHNVSVGISFVYGHSKCQWHKHGDARRLYCDTTLPLNDLTKVEGRGEKPHQPATSRTLTGLPRFTEPHSDHTCVHRRKHRHRLE